MKQFKVGDKVKIVEGGWGIHPCHEGKIVTIAACGEFNRYTWKEDLTSDEAGGYNQRAGQATADYRSFELVEDIPTVDLIREVNQQIHQETVAHEARLTALKANRDALVVLLLEELQ